MASRSSLLLALLAASVAVCHANSDANCVWDSGIGVTYDLSHFEQPAASYSIQDGSSNDWSTNYTYTFNVCQNTPTIPRTNFGNGLACVNTTGSNGQEIINQPSPAYQIYNEGNLCHRLGDTASNRQYSFYDEENPVAGVNLQYLGGDPCPFDWGDRSLTIHFLCTTDPAFQNILMKETVEETDKCKYDVFTASIYACPRECYGDQMEICSHHGVCGYDTDRKAAKCFCNPGYSGAYCSDEIVPESGLSAAGGVLIFICILLALVFGVLIYLWLQIRSLRLDTSAYKSLGGGPDSAGDTEL